MNRKLRKLIKTPRLYFVDMAKKRLAKSSIPIRYLPWAKTVGNHKYSVVCAVYGVEKYLEKFFTSMVNQTLDFAELFYVDNPNTQGIHALIEEMELLNANVVPTTLLDMYPKATNNSYRKGGDFLKHSANFDRLNSEYYERGGLLYGSFYHKKGGVRKRLFGTTVCIHKFPFFKYNFHSLSVSAGYHFFQDNKGITFNSDEICLLEKPAILLHFKFIKPDIESFFKRRIALNQDWDDSVEYKSYANLISKEKIIFFYDSEISTSIDCLDCLDEFLRFH